VLVASVVGEAGLPEQNKRFASALRSVGVKTTTHLYTPGTHSWPYWQNELHAIWPTVMRSIR
jgi:S-formylglutathione hydrolase FrmB